MLKKRLFWSQGLYLKKGYSQKVFDSKIPQNEIFCILENLFFTFLTDYFSLHFDIG